MKSCCLDPIPTNLLKDCLDILVPLITRMINQSFREGYVPLSFKLAAVTPLLKKANLIPEILKNFRPVSNLPYLSKVLERVATKQLIQYKEVNCLREPRQSAYREHHSTETAILRINHDLMMARDRKECTLMCLLDLSAAFDTVSHDVLLQRLKHRYGVRDRAHQWVESYLDQRRQFVMISGTRSREVSKRCDVPQGSVLGPNLYEDYMAPPVGEIFRRHGIQYMIYADDTQAYISTDVDHIDQAKKRLERCLREIRQWMAQNWLKLNDDKTEFIVFCNPLHQDIVESVTLTLGECEITQSDSVKSIGAHLDNGLNMGKQIISTCRSAWFHLYQIGQIRKYISDDQAKILVHSHVTSRLDNNNSLLLGLPKSEIKKLQRVQNAAARLVKGLKKRDHISPALRSLHWLPVEQRIIFKTVLMVYKSMHFDTGPQYLKELLKVYVPGRKLRSADELILVVPKCHYSVTAKRPFGLCGQHEWNKLPKDIRDKKTVSSFKSALKTYLFKIAFK